MLFSNILKLHVFIKLKFLALPEKLKQLAYWSFLSYYASTSFSLLCTGNRKSLTVEMEHLLLLWIEEWSQNQIPNPFVLKLVAVLKENGNYKDIYLLPIKAGFIVSKST